VTLQFNVLDSSLLFFFRFQGNNLQMTTSGLGPTNMDCYEREKGCYALYGFEYRPGNEGYITWINDGRMSWTFKQAGLGPQTDVGVGQRLVAAEPMYSTCIAAFFHPRVGY
jgi:beta-glucan synthesis-associated protein KRE6